MNGEKARRPFEPSKVPVELMLRPLQKLPSRCYATASCVLLGFIGHLEVDKLTLERAPKSSKELESLRIRSVWR